MTDLLAQPAKPPRSALATEQEAREVAEAAREKDWEAPSFVREMFEGSFRFELVHPYPTMNPADVEAARPFMERLERFLREKVDSDRIDREGKIPAEVIDGLRELGAFGIKIPKEYGGLGLSQTAYTHAIGMVTSVDGNLDGAALRRAVDRRAAAAQDLRHAGTEKEVSPAAGRGRGERLRADRIERRLRSRRDEHDRGALTRRHGTTSSTARSSGAPTARSPS